MEVQRRKAAVAWLSVLSNTTLVVLKVIVGLSIGSVSVISEAAHSSADLFASVIALLAVKSAGKPADREHPYGHGKIENLSGTIEAILIFLAAGWIIFEAVQKLLHPHPLEEAYWGIGIMLVSAVANILVSRMLFKVGNETDSVALLADAWHLRTDVWTSFGVMGGLSIIALGHWLLPGVNLQWLDPVAAMAVALLILNAAWELTHQAARDLLDVSLPDDEERWIREYLNRLAPTVCGFHRLRTRKSGANRFVEFHMQVDRAMSVAEAHAITDRVGDDIETRFPGTTVTVHVEPCDHLCKPLCREGCFLPDEERFTQQPDAPVAQAVTDGDGDSEKS
jgi:cation diffusion facilitator family transporter